MVQVSSLILSIFQDDRVHLEALQVEVYQCENCMFSDSDIIKLSSYCAIKTPLTLLTLTQKNFMRQL